MPRRITTLAFFVLLSATVAACAADSPPPAAGATAAAFSAGGAVFACPWTSSGDRQSAACGTGVSTPIARWKSLFGTGEGLILVMAVKSTADWSFGAGVAHVFPPLGNGERAPAVSAAVGVGALMPLSGAGGLRTLRPAVFVVLNIGRPTP